MPKGALLVGPPVGKTLLARQLQVKRKFVSSLFPVQNSLEMFVGMGAAKVRDLFKQPMRRLPVLYLLMD